MTAQRRCQRFACPRWLTLDLYDAAAPASRYCSTACERADNREIGATECHNDRFSDPPRRWPRHRASERGARP